LDLGAGLHGDLTGRENVFACAIVAGLKRREVERRFAQIVEFAELEQFIDNPVRTYSTGMMMRLAFAVAIHTQPDILLVDEYLSVGDVSFQSKCLERIQALKREGCAIVLISHSVSQIQELCDRALWLKQGEILACGTPKVVAGQYAMAMQTKTQQLTPAMPVQVTQSGHELRINQNRFGSLEAEIVEVKLLSSLGLPSAGITSAGITSGESLQIEITYQAKTQLEAPHFGVSITRPDGTVCLDTNTDMLQFAIDTISGLGRVSLVIDRLDLPGGQYFVNVGIFEQHWNYAYDYHWHVYPLTVAPTLIQKGMLAPPMRWSISTPASL
jgi:lipopolysaccharide transport system ATP-binding protein